MLQNGRFGAFDILRLETIDDFLVLDEREFLLARPISISVWYCFSHASSASLTAT